MQNWFNLLQKPILRSTVKQLWQMAINAEYHCQEWMTYAVIIAEEIRAKFLDMEYELH